MYRTVDQIRKEKANLPIIEFAKVIGISNRHYYERLYNRKKEDWRISQLIKISSFNDGKVQIPIKDKKYNISIHEVE